ncbi:hypothetical protein N2152v2_004068 [Parachlorella kessleri]
MHTGQHLAANAHSDWYRQHCESTLQQLTAVQGMQDLLRQLRGDGSLARIAAQLAVDLASGAAQPDTGVRARSDKATMPHQVRLKRLQAAADLPQLKELLRQLRDGGTLKRLAQVPPRQGAAAMVAGEAGRHERAAASGPQLGREAVAAESLAARGELPEVVPSQAAVAGAAAGTKRRRSQRPAAALGAMLTAGVLAQEQCNANDSVEAGGPGRVQRRRPGWRPVTPVTSPLSGLPQQRDQGQQQQQQKPEQGRAREPQQRPEQEQQQQQPEQQQQQQNQDREEQPAAEQSAGAHQPRPAPAPNPAATAAGPCISKLATLLSDCCHSPQAAAVGLTAKLVGAFLVAYSGHFTALQKQEAALLVEALLAGGQLEAVKGYLEGMTKLVAVGW